MYVLQLSDLWVLIIAPTAIVMISRFIVVYGGSIILRIASIRIPLQWQKILTLGGIERRNLRSLGVISSSRI